MKQVITDPSDSSLQASSAPATLSYSFGSTSSTSAASTSTPTPSASSTSATQVSSGDHKEEKKTRHKPLFELSEDQYIDYYTNVESLLKTSLLVSQLLNNQITLDALYKERIYLKISTNRPRDVPEAIAQIVISFNKAISSLPYAMLSEYAGDNLSLISLNAFAHEIYFNINNLSKYEDPLEKVANEIASKDMLICLMKVRLQLNMWANVKLYSPYIKPKDIEHILNITRLEKNC
jgi:hypothetical protein